MTAKGHGDMAKPLIRLRRRRRRKLEVSQTPTASRESNSMLAFAPLREFIRGMSD